MQQSRSKRYLIASLAAMVAFSAMAASVMSGCGCNDDKGTSTADETSVEHETQIVTHVETYTEVVTDSEGNTSYVDATKYVSGSSSQTGTEKSESSANGSSSSGGGSEKSESSDGSSSNGSASNNSSSNNSSSNGASSNADGGNDESGTLTIGGVSYNVGDTVVCTYTLTAPEVLENYQAYITYDSDLLECTNAEMSEEASGGSMLNYNNQGKVYITGSNISTGYDFTSGGTFITVTYTVKASGSTTAEYTWQVACNQNSENLISDGTPASGFKLTESYS